MVYLDYNATTPVAPEAIRALLPCLDRDFGNPSSAHRPGREARLVVERARTGVAELLGCEPGEILFTSGGTESNNLAIQGASAPDLLARLEGRVAASAGSACHEGGVSISPVLRAMGVPEEWARGTLRLSVGRPTTPEEIDRAVEAVAGAIS